MLKYIKFSIGKCSVIQFLGMVKRKLIIVFYIYIITELEVIIIAEWDLRAKGECFV